MRRSFLGLEREGKGHLETFAVYRADMEVAGIPVE
jgi:hypothetical protein